MSDYISREAAIDYLRKEAEECRKAFEELGGESGIYADAYNDLAEDFHRIPAADAEPVRRARWNRPYISWYFPLKIKNPYCFCTYCGQPIKPRKVTNYCPNCGAKMDLEDETHDN